LQNHWAAIVTRNLHEREIRKMRQILAEPFPTKIAASVDPPHPA
jgi:hypothetical protein